MKYILIQDNDCHWYVIPYEREEEWYDWTDSESDDVPDWAYRIGGAYTLIQFENPTYNNKPIF